MSQRKFSIITINYNNKEGLRKTIESVVGQSFRDFVYNYFLLSILLLTEGLRMEVLK